MRTVHVYRMHRRDVNPESDASIQQPRAASSSPYRRYPNNEREKQTRSGMHRNHTMSTLKSDSAKGRTDSQHMYGGVSAYGPRSRCSRIPSHFRRDPTYHHRIVPPRSLHGSARSALPDSYRCLSTSDWHAASAWLGMHESALIGPITIKLLRKRTIIVYESRTCH
jgi:hypothetical protein